MHGPAIDGLVDVDVAVSDFDVKTAVEISANPGLVVNGRPLAPKVR